jgi:hypothetical protein
MSQAPANASPPNNTLYLLLGLSGGLCLVCGGFAVVILVSVTSLSALAVSPKAPPTVAGQGEGPPSTENDRAASARGVAQGFLDDLKKGSFEDAYHRTGGLYRSQSTEDLKAYVRGFPSFQRPTKVVLGPVTRTGEIVTFKGNVENKTGKATLTAVFTIDMGMENGEWRVLEFKIID